MRPVPLAHNFYECDCFNACGTTGCGLQRYMAKKKVSKKKPSLKVQFEKTFYALALLTAVVVTAAITAHFIIGGKPPKPSQNAQKTEKRVVSKQAPAASTARTSKSTSAKAEKPAHKRQAYKKPAVTPAVTPPPEEEKAPLTPQYEVFPTKEIPRSKPAPIIKSLPPQTLPLVAIIIDDMGYDRGIAEKLIGLDTALTFSMFPLSPYGRKIAQKAHSRGLEIMLHLPMEPHEYPKVNPGPGVLLTSMSPDELIGQLRRNLEDVPYIRGVNNHMGSKMTASDTNMNQIFIILKKRKLFFIDSRTTTETLTRHSALLFKVPWAERDIFLDHFHDRAFIRKQFKELIRVARKQGHAVGIGHPYEVTYEILREFLPELQRKVKIVPASALVQILG